MADVKRIDSLLKSVNSVLEFKDMKLVARPDWGTISFKNAEHDLKRIFSLLSYFIILPVEYLTDSVIDAIKVATDATRPTLDEINKFSIEQQNAPQIRESLVSRVHECADELSTVAAPWVPFLAYQKGDVAQNIERLGATVLDARNIVKQAIIETQKKSDEIDSIITKAREASASAGAAVFTSDFKNESMRQETAARPWLTAAAGFAIASLGAAIITWFTPLKDLDNGQIVQMVSSKLIALTILITATLWCGKMYKALMHQSVTNRHRALGLQTFQAFSAAASDEQTKNAVLLETTRSIFAQGATGFINDGGSDGDTKIIEIAKAIVSKEP